MRVRIVCYEDVDDWILGKFALKMHECLSGMGIVTDIAKHPDSSADINHHIVYYSYDGKKHSTDTIMITHINDINKLDLIKKLLQNAEIGICMSRNTLGSLVKLGVPRNKLSYINPAHDGVIIPRPKIIGITSRVYNDGRKRQHYLSKLAKEIDSRLFSFKIMGWGWDKQVNELKMNGFHVEYTNHFDYNKYILLIQSLDYYLYMGQDEGQMGFIDALAAGVETIVTPQGYHLDAEGGITYSFDTYDELLNIFKFLNQKRLKLIHSVETWNWENYTKKHVEIWKYLISKNKIAYIPPRKQYSDGIYSIEQFDINIYLSSDCDRYIKLKLFYNNYKRIYFIYHSFWEKICEIIKTNGYKHLCKKIINKLADK